jgi:hypothetical protein
MATKSIGRIQRESAEVEKAQRVSVDLPAISRLRDCTFVKVPVCDVVAGIADNQKIGIETGDGIDPALICE